jgi:ribosomal protein L40E
VSKACFKNQLRGYDVVIATLQAFSKDICRRCIGLSGAQTKVIKGLKKLRMDLDKTSISEDYRREITAHVDACEKVANAIEMEEECECQKTAGNCKIGPGCLSLGALDLMKEITEPVLKVGEEEVSKVAKLVCEACGVEEPVPVVH